MREIVSLTLRRHLDKVQGVIIVLSAQGTVEFINKPGACLLGYDCEYVIGQNWFDNFIPPENRQHAKARFKKIIQGKIWEENAIEQYVSTNSGELRLISWRNTAVQDKNKKIIRVFSSGEDVTERHLLQRYLVDLQSRHRQERLSGIVEATEKERRFLACELHDGVNQVLTTCKLLLESELKNKPTVFIQKAFDHIQEAIKTLRDLSHDLNPAELGNEGLYEAVQKMVSRLNATGKIKITTAVEGFCYLANLCPRIGLSLYRIMQEALTNIIKHAGACHVRINLFTTPDSVDIEIRDDGNGFDRNHEKIGLGLKSIYTRAEAAGGKAYIVSNPGKGTSLSVHIPFKFADT